MIVDFRVENQSGGYVKSDILEKFYEGNGEFSYSGLMSLVIGIPQEQKLCILRESLRTWCLLDNIDKTVLEQHHLILKYASNGNGGDDFQRYIEDAKETIKILSTVE